MTATPKDIYIVRSDIDENDRNILAMILNQYKREVAAKHQINLKPVILFKAKRTIEQSKTNKAEFHKLIDGLTGAHVAKIRRSNIPLVQRAFQFFDDNNITDDGLAERLKQEFREEYCLFGSTMNARKRTINSWSNTLEDPRKPHSAPSSPCRN